MSGTIIDGGCSTCGTITGGSGIAMGSVIPGTIIDGEVISGGVIPGEIISDGVIFDGRIVDGGTVSGDSHQAAKPCSGCGKYHTNISPSPAARQPEENLPGQINQGTLKPQTPPDPDTDEKVPAPGTTDPPPQQTDRATDASATASEPELFPGTIRVLPKSPPVSRPVTHPPAGSPRARTTPSSWRNSPSRTATPARETGGDFHQPLPRPGLVEPEPEPTTLMIPTIPDEGGTRHVHWVPEDLR